MDRKQFAQVHIARFHGKHTFTMGYAPKGLYWKIPTVRMLPAEWYNPEEDEEHLSHLSESEQRKYSGKGV